MSNDKPVKKSRWAGPKIRELASAVKFPPRYTDAERDRIMLNWHEKKGWHKGARIRRAA